MHFATTVTALGLAASVVNASPIKRQNAGTTVLYWGQNAPGENQDLNAYCGSDAGVNTVVLAFLNDFGTGHQTNTQFAFPGGGFGLTCTIRNADGQPEGAGCAAIGQAITNCQNNNVRVILSLGGAGAFGDYGLASQEEAERVADQLWASYGPNGGSGPRPFGDAVVDGFDLDIEATDRFGNANYPALVNRLRSNFGSDTSKEYFIAGAPQCPIPEPNMGNMIAQSEFDLLYVQFYNNPSCSVGTSGTNFDTWVSDTANGASSGAQIFLGVPASTTAATGDAGSGGQYYLDPSALAGVVSRFSGNARWGGIMAWSAGYSDGNPVNGCSYIRNAFNILTTGSPC